MALTSKTLAELARLSSGINPTFSAQAPSAPNADLVSPVTVYGSVVAEDLNDGDGVDISNATHSVIRVVPTGGDCVFDVVARSTNQSNKFETLNGLEGVSTSKPWKEIIFCGPEDELVVIIQSGTATSVEVEVGPCLG